MRVVAEPSGISELSDTELTRLAATAFTGAGSILLAVSGGADSMTLLLMTAVWRKSQADTRVPIHVATVDHGLRAQSTTEAQWVGEQARKLELPHHILTWTGTKPETGRQDAARRARYRLLADLAATFSPGSPAAVVTAHHLDDQAETLLMRLARGSGVDGLAAMPSSRPMSDTGHPDVQLVRPFLHIPKARLIATLLARGLPWVEDPGNDNPQFERVRIRRALALQSDADPTPDGLTASAIALGAARLARARDALEQMTTDLASAILQLHDGAFAEVDPARFDAAPAELRLRLLQRMWRFFGAPGDRPRLARLEALLARLEAGQPFAATLAGGHLQRTSNRITLTREPGRQGLPELQLDPSATLIWDGRFRFTAAPDLKSSLTIKALTPAALSALTTARRHGKQPPIALPRRAILTLPSLWLAGRLLGVPHPALPPLPPSLATADFIGNSAAQGGKVSDDFRCE